MPPVFHFRQYRSYIKSPGISSLQIHTESLFYSKSPTKPYWADPSTFCLFILNNKAIWIQTTAQLFTRFSVPIYRKPLDFTTFSAITIFITRCTSLSKMQKISILPLRLTHSFRVKIGVHQQSPTAYRVKTMLSLSMICLSKTLFSAVSRAVNNSFSMIFPVILRH